MSGTLKTETYLPTYSWDIDSVILQLKKDSNSLLEWFSINGFKANTERFHLILSNPDQNLFIEIDGHTILNNKSEKLFGIKFDSKLNFDIHVSEWLLPNINLEVNGVILQYLVTTEEY